MAIEYVHFESTPQANIIQLRLPESLEAAEFDELNETMLGLLKGQPSKKWILDLSNVTYMGSAMLGMLVNVRHQIKSGGGRLLLCGLSKPLMGIFRTCCMERLFTIVKDRAAALSA